MVLKVTFKITARIVSRSSLNADTNPKGILPNNTFTLYLGKSLENTFKVTEGIFSGSSMIANREQKAFCQVIHAITIRSHFYFCMLFL